jgi:class 3 adenylate cyclase
MNSGRQRVERRLAAILAVDVAGYSRLMGEDEEGTLAALRAVRRELADRRIAEHRGRIVKTTGDGLRVEFASVVDAVRCAVEVQREMIARNAAVPAQRRIEFRTGINLGDIIIEDGDIFGDSVNIAARLEALAEPGGICLSAAAHEQVRDRLDLAFDDLGEQQVKNIARPVRVYRIPITLTLPTPEPVLGPRKARTRGARAPSLSRIAGEGEPRRASDAVGEGKRALALPNKPSLAVLPFQNLTDDPEQGYFVDGMVEEITTAIARLPWLFAYTLFLLAGEAAMAAAALDRALALNPNAALAWLIKGNIHADEPEAAIEAVERARRLSPFDPYAFLYAFSIALAHLAAHRFEQAIQWADRTLHDQPRMISAMRVKVVALAHFGHRDEARAELSRVLAIDPKLTIAGYRAYGQFMAPKVLELYVAGLRLAGLPEGEVT